MDEFKRRKRMTIHERAKDYIQMKEEMRIRRQVMEETIRVIYLTILIVIVIWILVLTMLYKLIF